MIDIDIDRTYSGTEFPKVLSDKRNYKYYVYVPFILSEEKEEELTVYTWQYLMINANEYNYGKLVESIIELKYSSSEVIARLNNYISESDNEKYKREYEELASWRKQAKEYAKKHFNML
jgi:hypothetical protein